MTDINWRPISEEPPEGDGRILFWSAGSEIVQLDNGKYEERLMTYRQRSSATHYALINPPGGRDE